MLFQFVSTVSDIPQLEGGVPGNLLNDKLISEKYHWN